MMKNIFVALFCLFLLNVQAQSVDDANSWFDRYEYELAAESYEKITDINSLTVDDLRRWCYAAFVTGNYVKSLAISDSLLKNHNKNPPYFYYVNGYASMALGQLDKAKNAFIKYKNLDTTYFVDSLIVACDEIPNWKTKKHIELTHLDLNGEKADFNGQFYNRNILFFNEGGKNKYKKDLSNDSLERAELVLSRPSLYSPNKKRIQTNIKLPLGYQYYNMSSLTYNTQNEQVLVTLYNLLSEDKLLHAPQLYTGNIDSNFTLNNLKIWKYSGINDTTSTAQAVINKSGNVMVFTKQGQHTQRADLYLSTKNENGSWTKPQEIKELNTQGDDMFPLFSGDTALLFSSNARVGYGGLDIYLAKITTDNNFYNITHLKSPINSFGDDYNYVSVRLPYEKSAYFSSNRRYNNKADDDIYYIKYENIDTSKHEKIIDDWKDIIVYFEFDKYNLEQNDLEQISKAKELLTKWDDFKLLIEGHTDSRGSDNYNLKLGAERAQSVAQQLIEFGFKSEDFIIQTKGENEPALDCTGCTNEEHRLNRFVLIRLVSKSNHL